MALPEAWRPRLPPESPAPACRYCRADAESDQLAQAPLGATQETPWLAHLYLCLGLSTYTIAERTGVDRQRVTRALRKSGVPLRPRGAGRLRPERRDWNPDLPRLISALYEGARLDSRQVAAILGMPERTVRDRMRRYGIAARTRGGWNREDRAKVSAEVLEYLYSELGMTAAEVGGRLGMSGNTVLRNAHAFGIPVRSGGIVPLAGPDDIELVTALYADPLIDAVLTAHAVPRVPAGGPLTDRFPRPVPLTIALVKDLYWGCGAGLSHIELLTGQPSESIRGFMRRAAIPVRHPGGRTPFLRRWRSGNATGYPRRLVTQPRATGKTQHKGDQE